MACRPGRMSPEAVRFVVLPVMASLYLCLVPLAGTVIIETVVVN